MTDCTKTEKVLWIAVVALLILMCFFVDPSSLFSSGGEETKNTSIVLKAYPTQSFSGATTHEKLTGIPAPKVGVATNHSAACNASNATNSTKSASPQTYREPCTLLSGRRRM